MNQFILAVDQGTTSSRAILFDHAGSIRAVAQREFTQYFPQPGLVEHDANEIWSTQAGVVTECVAKAGVDFKQIAAIGITNQRETVVVWDRETGNPICHAIVWQDRRTAEHCDALKRDGLEPMIRQKTGLVLDAYFSATKLKWILDHVEGARKQAEAGKLAFGTIDSWLTWKLTGGAAHITDVSNASRTLLYNIHTNQWDDELLELFAVPRIAIAAVRTIPASVTRRPRRKPFSLRACRWPGIAGDQQAALFGQMCLQPGHARKHRAAPARSPVLQHRRHARCIQKQSAHDHSLEAELARTTYALEGSIFIAGAVVQWLRDGLGVIRSSAEVEQLAATVKDNGGVYLVPAFAGLSAPHWDRSRGERSRASRAEPQRATSPAPLWKASPIKRPMCSKRCRRTPAFP